VPILRGSSAVCMQVRARPNKGIDRSAQQRRFACCRVPAALRAPAPGHAGRWALGRECITSEGLSERDAPPAVQAHKN